MANLKLANRDQWRSKQRNLTGDSRTTRSLGTGGPTTDERLAIASARMPIASALAATECATVTKPVAFNFAGGDLGPSYCDRCMDFIIFIQPPLFYEQALAEFEVSMDSDWYGHFVRLPNILMKSDKSLTKRTGQSLRPDGQQVLAQGHECGSAMIDTLHDYVVRSQ